MSLFYLQDVVPEALAADVNSSLSWQQGTLPLRRATPWYANSFDKLLLSTSGNKSGNHTMMQRSEFNHNQLNKTKPIHTMMQRLQERQPYNDAAVARVATIRWCNGAARRLSSCAAPCARATGRPRGTRRRSSASRRPARLGSACIYTYVDHVYISLYIHIIYVYIHVTYIYIYIYTHVYIYIYIYM